MRKRYRAGNIKLLQSCNNYTVYFVTGKMNNYNEYFKNIMRNRKLKL